MNYKVVVKIGYDPDEDLKKVFENPKKYAKPGTHTIYLKSLEEFPKLFSPESLRLMQQIIRNEDKEPNVSTLSRKLNRSQESISRDLKKLEENNLITKIKKGKSVFPKVNTKEILVQLA